MNRAYFNGLKAAANQAADFDPLQLFANGENGAWYDQNDTSTLFQDLSATIPATSDGDPVRVMIDKSGNGNNMIAPSDDTRPLLAQAGGRFYLDMSGLKRMSATGFTGSGNITPYYGGAKFEALTTGTQAYISKASGTAVGGNDWSYLNVNNNGTVRIAGIQFPNAGDLVNQFTTPPVMVSETKGFDGLAAFLLLNEQAEATEDTGLNSTYQDGTIFLSSRNNGLIADMNFFGMVYVEKSSAVTTEEKDQLHNYIKSL